METIKNYLYNMFINLPDTAEIRKIKESLMSDMEEKYHELKDQGRSENEAIGIVISEFGNIEELVGELGYSVESADKKVRYLEETEVKQIILDKGRWHKLIAAGVFICIMAPAVFMFVESVTSSDFMMIAPTFIMIAVAVVIFITASMNLDKYKFLEKEAFGMSVAAQGYVQQEQEGFRKRYTFFMALGVMLCILSPVLFMGVDEKLDSTFSDVAATSVMLICIGIAVTMFIINGCRMGTFKQLLQAGEYNAGRRRDKIVETVSAIVWPLAVVIYLSWSFYTKRWDITWIIWPATAILFWIFSEVVSIVKR